MKMTSKIIVGTYLIINIIAFLFMALDKYFAVRQKWRISEMTLVLISVFGGSIGSLIGMIVWRHKINKPKFRFGIPVIILIQTGAAFWLLYANFIQLSFRLA